MKRSRGITLLVGFLLIFAAYILWSALPFFMGPKLKFRASVPSEAKQVIEEWYAKYEDGDPESFSVGGYAYFLAHPYEAGVSHYVVTYENSKSLKVDRSGYGAFWVELEDGRWQIDRASKVMF